MPARKHLASLIALATASASPCALAQQLPDAGRMLREQPNQLELPAEEQRLSIEQPVATPVAPGGPRVLVSEIHFDGNTVFSEEELERTLGEYRGEQLDLAGLQTLAARITDHYRRAGYPFARAYLPPQQSNDGSVRIAIVEGRYGEIRVRADDPQLERAGAAYLAQLRPGELVSSRPLERAALLLGDLPGIRVSPVARAGAAAGTSDLIVEIERDERMRADVIADNHGNRYSGAHRLGGRLTWSSPFMLGDRVTVDALASDEDLLVGGIDYSRPLGASGLRANVGYAHTYYELGKEFAALDATGQAQIAGIGLAYPLLRSQSVSLSLGTQYQHKALEDEYRSLDMRDRKHSHVFSTTAQLTVRDALGGGGVTFGALTWTQGRLHLAHSLRAADAATSRTHGDFTAFALDLQRLQRLPGNFSVYARIAAQLALDNLDSSESFGLGGIQGVRAYPSGEAYGDEGWLGQLELRYSIGAFAPYAFFDYGEIDVHAEPGPLVTQVREHRAGVGMGLRWQSAGWQLDAALAWRTSGGRPESDTRDDRPRPWLSLVRQF
jgi:hemolysin activation/secretion protein